MVTQLECILPQVLDVDRSMILKVTAPRRRVLWSANTLGTNQARCVVIKTSNENFRIMPSQCYFQAMEGHVANCVTWFEKTYEVEQVDKY